MFSDPEKEEVLSRVRRSRLNCLVQFGLDGVITLLDKVPIDIGQILKVFPTCRVVDYGQRLCDLKTDEVRKHWFVDLVLINA